eukprot:482369_1
MDINSHLFTNPLRNIKRREPNCALRVTLRSKNHNTRQTYHGLCTPYNTKIYSDSRQDKKKISNDKHSLKRKIDEIFSDNESNKENTPYVRPTKRRKKNKSWGNKGKQSNKYRAQSQIEKENANQKKFRDCQDFKISKTEEVIAKINHCLDTIPLLRIRRYFRKMRRFEDAYIGGATSQNVLDKVEQLKKEKRQHRTALRI